MANPYRDSKGRFSSGGGRGGSSGGKKTIKTKSKQSMRFKAKASAKAVGNTIDQLENKGWSSEAYKLFKAQNRVESRKGMQSAYRKSRSERRSSRG